MENFIGVFPNTVGEEYCKRVIEFYKDCEKLNITHSRAEIEKRAEIEEQGLNLNRTGLSVDNDIIFLLDVTNNLTSYDLRNEFGKAFWECYEEYDKEYKILTSLSEHKLNIDLKIQKNEKTKGYHIWHCETTDRSSCGRLLMVLLFLNNVDEGGELEFLYQSKRIKPEAGTMVICPASFTHTHRGNPPLSGEKYILNGWCEFTR